MGEVGRNELNDNGRRLLTFATDNRLAVLNTFFHTRRDGIWHTYNGPAGDECKCLDYILTRRSHRGRVSNIEVVPQPIRPVRADSDHNIVVATVDLGGRLAHNRPIIRTSPKQQFNRQDLQVEVARRAVSQRFLCSLLAKPGAPAATAQEMAEEFTEFLLGAAKTELSEEPRRRHALAWNMTAAARAALAAALDKRREARHGFKASPNAATFRILKVACKGVKATIATSIYDHLEKYVTELEAVYQSRAMRGLYQHLKRSTGQGGRQAGGQQLVTDENGVFLRNKDAILKRWRRFFDTLLNSKFPTLNPDVVEQVAQRPTTRATRRLEAVPDPEEIEAATNGFGNWKAVGPDLLAAELLKELGRRRRVPLYMCFIDLQKAYDSVDRELLWKVLTRAGIPAEMIAVIRKFHVGMRARVCMDDGELSDWFPSAEGLARMMTIIVEVLREFGLTVLERKTETLVMRVKEKQPPLMPPPPLIIEVAGQRHGQTTEFRYLGGLVNDQGDLTREIHHRSKAARACFKRYKTELFERPGAPFDLKARLLKAEAVEALLYGCVTWSPRRDHYRLLQTTHHKLLLRIIGHLRKRAPTGSCHTPTGAEEGRLPERGGHHPSTAHVLAGAVARQPDKRLPKRLMFGELAGGEKQGKGSPEQNWLTCLKDDLRIFGATHGSTDDAPCVFGVPKSVWSEAAKVEGGVPWHAGVLQGAERFMTSWHKGEE
eukprot:g17640.t1